MALKEFKLRKIIREEILKEVHGGESGAGNPVSVPPDVKSSVRAKSVELVRERSKHEGCQGSEGEGQGCCSHPGYRCLGPSLRGRAQRDGEKQFEPSNRPERA